MHLIWAGAILGIAAVWGVPILAGLLKAILPAQAQPYLPSSTVPSVNAQAFITAFIYGLFVFATLMVLEGIGRAAHRRVRVGV